MHAHGIEILHAAYGDNVARPVAHNFKFDFLPAVDVTFHQHLCNRRKQKTCRRDFPQFFFVLSDAAAAASQRKRRPDNDRIPDAPGGFCGLFDRTGNFRRNHGLPELLHRLTEKLSVLRTVDCFGRSAEEPHTHFFKKALFCKLHGKRQAGLSAQSHQQAVGTFLLDNTAQTRQSQRLKIDLIGQCAVCHDCGRIGVCQHDVDARLFQNAAGLRTRVVKLRRLSDDNRPGADHKYFFDRSIQRHRYPSIFFTKRSNRKRASHGPLHASG